MHAPSFVVLAAGAMSASAAYMVEEPHSTTTSTSTLTHLVTITKCNPTNTLCPLYTPTTTPSSVVVSTTSSTTSSTPTPTTSSTSSSYPVFTPPPAPPAPVSSSSSAVVSSSSSSPVPVYSVKSFPALNSTTPAAFPTAYYNTTTPKSTMASPTPATLTSVAAVPSEPAGGNNGGSGYPTAPAPSPVPTGGAASLQAGLMMVMGAVAALVL
ncbi:hypothetical protein PG997_004797 [Apiospora hydei]|uniref:GPI anchored serine-rich protein n=1 Tax=Apiospora hydei TaxID=1337664 RepID=A0ABR1X376_9PEZI